MLYQLSNFVLKLKIYLLDRVFITEFKYANKIFVMISPEVKIQLFTGGHFWQTIISFFKTQYDRVQSSAR